LIDPWSSSIVDYEKLKAWVYRARELCEESDRIEVCDIQIGELLAHAESEGAGRSDPRPGT